MEQLVLWRKYQTETDGGTLVPSRGHQHNHFVCASWANLWLHNKERFTKYFSKLCWIGIRKATSWKPISSAEDIWISRACMSTDQLVAPKKTRIRFDLANVARSIISTSGRQNCKACDMISLICTLWGFLLRRCGTHRCSCQWSENNRTRSRSHVPNTPHRTVISLTLCRNTLVIEG